MGALAEWTSKQFDPTLNWNDIAWIRKRWGGKLILKGIRDQEDARLAVDSGADALIVSNHGGRQLDGAPSSNQCFHTLLLHHLEQLGGSAAWTLVRFGRLPFLNSRHAHIKEGGEYGLTHFGDARSDGNHPLRRVRRRLFAERPNFPHVGLEHDAVGIETCLCLQCFLEHASPFSLPS